MDDFPTKNRKRAKRRFLKAKFKNRAKRVFKFFGWPQENACKLADNMAFCNCMMCQNPRKVFKEKTLQEKKADEDFEDQKDLRPDAI